MGKSELEAGETVHSRLFAGKRLSCYDGVFRATPLIINRRQTWMSVTAAYVEFLYLFWSTAMLFIFIRNCFNKLLYRFSYLEQMY